MNFLTRLFTLILLASMVGLTACQAAPSEVNSPVLQTPPGSLDELDNGIMIEGQVVPAANYSLSFAAAGRVEAVLVKEGDRVAEGQEIARLNGQEQADAAVKAADLELQAARQALQTLTDAQKSNQNQAFLSVLEARQLVEDSETRLEALTGGTHENEIAAVKAQIVLAENKLDNAIDSYEEYEDYDEDSTTRASYQLRVTDAQREYDQALRLLDNLEGDGYDFLLELAQDTLKSAQEQLRLAEERYAEVSEGPDAETIKIAESRIAAAEAGLLNGQASLASLFLRAPAAGTVVKVQVKEGELLALGQPFGILADLSEWYVETVDLTETDVVNVSPGQAVQVSANALPGVQMKAVVQTIGDIYQDVRGDITYVARIKLEETEPRLRWGMTVFVEFSPP